MGVEPREGMTDSELSLFGDGGRSAPLRGTAERPEADLRPRGGRSGKRRRRRKGIRALALIGV